MRSPNVHWDIDRYDELQDGAWELDSWAAEQDHSADQRGVRSEGPTNRARANRLRDQAALLLAEYWAILRASDDRTSVARRYSPGIGVGPP
jgi:hypothetical protein